jgi:hypothetical protein
VLRRRSLRARGKRGWKRKSAAQEANELKLELEVAGAIKEVINGRGKRGRKRKGVKLKLKLELEPKRGGFLLLFCFFWCKVIRPCTCKLKRELENWQELALLYNDN